MFLFKTVNFYLKIKKNNILIYKEREEKGFKKFFFYFNLKTKKFYNFFKDYHYFFIDKKFLVKKNK